MHVLTQSILVHKHKKVSNTKSPHRLFWRTFLIPHSPSPSPSPSPSYSTNYTRYRHQRPRRVRDSSFSFLAGSGCYIYIYISIAATAALAVAASVSVSDYSLFSAESNFRELDDVFLQTQARIWLGEVLQTRLDENLNISDLLADGELLFELSGVIWKMLLTRYMELRNIKAYIFEPLTSRKSSGKYMPYSNVDSFVKICKILGLTGIDLFSPSDVVEKRNTRKVCMCIRSLSKKARSKQLNVPDFDKVTCTVVMPTDMVGCIRRSLEQLQHSILSNASVNADHGLIENFKQNNSMEAYDKKCDMCSEESDDLDCNFMIQSAASSTTCYHDASSQITFDLKDSPGVSSLIEEYAPDRLLSTLEKSRNQFESLCEKESAGHSCLLLGKDDYRWDGLLSSTCVDSLLHLRNRASGVKTISYDYENGTFNFDDRDLQNCLLEGSIGGNKGERSDLTDKLSTPNMIFQEMNTTAIQFVMDCNSFGGCRSSSSHGSNSTPRLIEKGFRSKICDVNNGEVSSTAGISPVSSVVQTLDFDDQLDVGSNITTVLSELQNQSSVFLYDKPENVVKYKTLVDHSTCITNQPPVELEVKDVGSSTKLVLPSLDTQSCTTNDSDHGVLHDKRICTSLESKVGYDEGKQSQHESNVLKDVHCNQSLELLLDQSCSPFDVHLWDQKGKCAIAKMSTEHDGNNGHRTFTESVSQEGLALEIESVSQKGLTVEIASCYLAKDTEDALVKMDIKPDIIINDKVLSATLLQSGHTNNHFQTICSSIASNSRYKDLKASAELWSANKDIAFQHRDIMIQHYSGQNRNIPAGASADHPSMHHNVEYPPVEKIKDKRPCSTTECQDNLCSESSLVCIDHKNDCCCVDNTFKMQNEDNKKHEDAEILAVEKSHSTDCPGVAGDKPFRRLLLKSVVRGTAVFGLLFLFLRLRKSSREEKGESNMQLDKIKEENGRKLSWKKRQEERGVKRVYPANKLGFRA